MILLAGYAEGRRRKPLSLSKTHCRCFLENVAWFDARIRAAGSEALRFEAASREGRRLIRNAQTEVTALARLSPHARGFEGASIQGGWVGGWVGGVGMRGFQLFSCLTTRGVDEAHRRGPAVVALLLESEERSVPGDRADREDGGSHAHLHEVAG